VRGREAGQKDVWGRKRDVSFRSGKDGKGALRVAEDLGERGERRGEQWVFHFMHSSIIWIANPDSNEYH